MMTVSKLLILLILGSLITSKMMESGIKAPPTFQLYFADIDADYRYAITEKSILGQFNLSSLYAKLEKQIEDELKPMRPGGQFDKFSVRILFIGSNGRRLLIDRNGTVNENDRVFQLSKEQFARFRFFIRLNAPQEFARGLVEDVHTRSSEHVR